MEREAEEEEVKERDSLISNLKKNAIDQEIERCVRSKCKYTCGAPFPRPRAVLVVVGCDQLEEARGGSRGVKRGGAAGNRPPYACICVHGAIKLFLTLSDVWLRWLGRSVDNPRARFKTSLYVVCRAWPGFLRPTMWCCSVGVPVAPVLLPVCGALSQPSPSHAR